MTLVHGGASVPAQQDALKEDTQLVVGGMGGNTVGFTSVIEQCSAMLRGDEGRCCLAGR
ncbi:MULTISPECIES: hypothetical protein [Streptomyces]|uniref:hypothetical protein n=1 Tax=Streptomyces TaxID=1883 RepID=UPI00278C1781|nr:hypothetical protein [Streptomyces hydrogenans]